MSGLLQVCQPGYDVRTCPDWAFLFNSQWPSLAIAYETTVDNPSGGSASVNHNLGYPPLTMVWGNFSGDTYGRQAAGFSVNSTKLQILNLSGATTLTIRCFNIDISTEQEYELPQAAQAKFPYNNQFGIKQVKQNRNIQSNNLNDFIIHSRAQSPAVLTVATQNGKYFTNTNPGSQYTGPWIVYPLQTSFIPWVYAMSSAGSGLYTFQTINALQFINQQIVMPLEGSTIGSLVILRDPLFYPNEVSVVY